MYTAIGQKLRFFKAWKTQYLNRGYYIINKMISPILKALRVSLSPIVAFTGAGGKTTALFQLARALSKNSPVIVTASSHLGTWQVSLADQHLMVNSAGKLDGLESNLQGVTLITGAIDGN